MSELSPITVAEIRNDGESVRLSLRGDDGTLATATVPCENMNYVVNLLIQGFLAASVRATHPASNYSDFAIAPQTFRATDIQLTADINTDATYLTISTVENTELLISVEPLVLAQLIDVASQRQGARSESDATH